MKKLLICIILIIATMAMTGCFNADVVRPENCDTIGYAYSNQDFVWEEVCLIQTVTTTTETPATTETTEDPYPISVDAEYVMAAFDKLSERIVNDPEMAVEVVLGILESRDVFTTTRVQEIRAGFYDLETIELLPLNDLRIAWLIELYNIALRDILG